MKKVTPLRMAKEVTRHVRRSLSIGPENIIHHKRRMTSIAKTGLWADHMVSEVRKGFTAHIKLTHRPARWILTRITRMKRPAISTKLQEEHNLDFFEKEMLMSISGALINYAGNCQEMSELALLRLAKFAQDKHLNLKNFKFEILKLEGVDHVFVKMTIGKQKLICDPWLDFACIINKKNIARFKDVLYIECDEEDRKGIDEYWHENEKILLSDEPLVEPCIDQSVNNHGDAEKLTTLVDEHHANVLRLWPAFYSDPELAAFERSEHAAKFKPVLEELTQRVRLR